jgi:hypothetical protein
VLVTATTAAPTHRRLAIPEPDLLWHLLVGRPVAGRAGVLAFADALANALSG